MRGGSEVQCSRPSVGRRSPSGTSLGESRHFDAPRDPPAIARTAGQAGNQLTRYGSCEGSCTARRIRDCSRDNEITTVKDLCRTVLAVNYADFCRSTEIPLDDRCLDIWERLTAILVDTLGVERDDVTFHARLVKDLAME